MFRFETLDIWKESSLLAKEIYLLTSDFPREEIYGLTSQIRRAVVSISTNIAEGSASITIKDYQNCLAISRKSVFEVASLLNRACELGYLDEKTRLQHYEECQIVAKKIFAFSKSLRNYSKHYASF